jgi:hypothetical protein
MLAGTATVSQTSTAGCTAQDTLLVSSSPDLQMKKNVYNSKPMSSIGYFLFIFQTIYVLQTLAKQLSDTVILSKYF